MTVTLKSTGKSSIYRRKESPFWWVRRTVSGLGEIRVSTRTKNEKLARRYDDLVCELREHGRMDALVALKNGAVSLQELHTHREPQRLADLLKRAVAPLVRPLLKEWLQDGASDTGIRDSSMERYARSWKHLLQILPDGARLDDLDQTFVTEFKRHRYSTAKERGKLLKGATLNRDLAALGAFLSWCSREKGLAVQRPTLKYQQETRGRTRWLSQDESARFRDKCPAHWWPLFGLLLGTGITISEALGLRVCDLDLVHGHLSIHEGYGRKLKRTSRARELAIPKSLLSALAAHIDAGETGPTALVFSIPRQRAQRAWASVCKAAKISGASIHDARHTFAVHAVMHGVPEARLQRLLGHSHPGTTRRYAMFAPGQFVKEDAETVAKSLGLNTPDLVLPRGA